MIRSLILPLLVVLSFTAAGQSNSQLPVMKTSHDIVKLPKRKFVNSEKANVIWSSTFNNLGEWELAHDTAQCNLDWTIGNDTCGGTFPLPNIQSTTANDGWALLDSDKYGDTVQGAELEDSWLTTASPVDLTGYPYVQVEFETFYRRFDYETPYLVVGFGDGSGISSVVWPVLTPSTDISTMSNVFKVFPDYLNNQISNNPEIVTINISKALENRTALELQNVYVRLNWTGTWGYAWFVDDFKVIEQPANDSKIIDTRISGVNKFGIQYGRIPQTQSDDQWIIGATIKNVGGEIETNLDYSVNYPSLTTSGNLISLGPDTSFWFNDTISATLTSGTHNGIYSVTSDNDTVGGTEYVNNSWERTIEITAGSNVIYSTDAIGLHQPLNEKLGSLGTGTFMINNLPHADAFTLANLYPVHTFSEASGIRVLLAPGSKVSGELIAVVIDSVDFMAGDMDVIYESQPFYIAANNLVDGYIDVFFDDEVALDTGVYYVGARISSISNLNDVMILDDQTIIQPEFASAMYIDNDVQVYSNGNALGIQLLMGNDWSASLPENKELGFELFPNPTLGTVYLMNEGNDPLQLVISDIRGTVIKNVILNNNLEVDLSSLAGGIYIFTVSDGTTKRAERVILNK